MKMRGISRLSARSRNLCVGALTLAGVGPSPATQPRLGQGIVSSLGPACLVLHLWSALDRTPRQAESAIRAAKRRNNWLYLKVSKADCSTGFTLQDTTALGSSAPALIIAPLRPFSGLGLAGNPALATAQAH